MWKRAAFNLPTEHSLWPASRNQLDCSLLAKPPGHDSWTAQSGLGWLPPKATAPPYDCWVVPRTGATVQQRQALAQALCRWHEDLCQQFGLRLELDNLALLGSLAEALPQAVLELFRHPHVPGESNNEPAAPHGGDHEAGACGTEGQAIYLALPGGQWCNRRQTIAGLRDHIPANLVEDILIDGRTWDVLD